MEPLQLFKILGDQTRLDIVLLLKASGELCVCDIYTALNLSQPKTSRHLAMLREAGLLLDSKHGKWVHYRLSPALLPWVKVSLMSPMPQRKIESQIYSKA